MRVVCKMKKGLSEESNVVMLGVLALALVGVFAYVFWIVDGEPITGEVVREEEFLSVCSLDYNPVCGRDGRTYSNLCLMEAEDVELNYGGRCVFAGIIYFNGSIATAEGFFFEHVDAIALKSGGIVFLGDQDEAMLFGNENTIMKDLEGGGLLIEFAEGSFSRIKSVRILSVEAVGEMRREPEGQKGVEIILNFGNTIGWGDVDG